MRPPILFEEVGDAQSTSVTEETGTSAMSSKMAAVTRCLYIFIFFLVLLASSSSKPLNISRTLSVGKENDTKRKKPLLEDHIKGLKLERDGHVNKEYHHEAFLGKMVEDGVLLFDNVDGSRRLIEIFHKVDKNEDHKVSKEEMKDWIHERIKEHIQEAKDNNHRMFKIVDRNGDGVVTWDEFRLKFKEDNETKKKDSTELGKFAFNSLRRCRPQLCKTLSIHKWN